MKKAKKFLYLFIILFFIQFIFIHTSFAVENTNNLKIYSPSYILMEASTGKILAENNPNEVMPPASTTKIMTAILTVENCKLDEIATVSHNAIFSVPPSYSIASLREGEELTVEQLLNVLLIQSANDAANVLAEHIAGSVEEFAKMMNDKAKELGCKNTNFVNANGVEEDDHYSTAYDLALMGKYAMQNSTIRNIVTKTQYTLPKTNKYDKEDRIFNTTNDLIREDYSDSKDNYYYEYANGLKTGYTTEAGSCIVATAKKDNLELIAVVLGGETTDDGLSERNLDCITLFNYGFDNYKIENVHKANDVMQQIDVFGATADTQKLDVVVKNDINLFLDKNTDISQISPDIELNDNLKAPISMGDTIGKISYNINDTTYSSDLIAGSSVYKSDILSTIIKLLLAILALCLLFKLLKPYKSKSRKSSKSTSKRKKKSGKHSKNNTFRINKYLR